MPTPMDAHGCPSKKRRSECEVTPQTLGLRVQPIASMHFTISNISLRRSNSMALTMPLSTWPHSRVRSRSCGGDGRA